MNDVFQFYVYSAPATGIFLLAAIFLHFLLRKKTGSQLYFIWLFVLLRLLFPVALHLNLEFGAYAIPQAAANAMSGNQSGRLTLSEKQMAGGVQSGNTAGVATHFQQIFMVVWFLGVFCFIAYYFSRMFALNKKRKNITRIAAYQNVWMWKNHMGACVAGLIRPQIYVPQGCSGKDLHYMVKHEQQHIRHFDHIFVCLFYFALALNWYHPLAWVAYKMAIQDMEKACDERVLAGSTVKERQDYARTLVGFYKTAATDSVIAGFGTSNIVSRIKNIGENKKKKKVYTVLIVGICCILFGVCALIHMNTGFREVTRSIAKDNLGADMPNVMYADADQCLFYDYHGVFVYDLKNKKIVDYLSFAKLGFSSDTQGENATFAYSGDKGKMIYITDHKKWYTYDCGKKEGRFITDSSTSPSEASMDSLQESDTQETGAIGSVYTVDSNTKVYWMYEGDTGKYSGLILAFNKNGNVVKYSVFQ